MLKKILVFFSFFSLFFCIWEIFSRSFSSCLFILPCPSEIFITLFTLHDRFLLHTMYTTREMLGGFGLALCVSFPLAWVMLQYRRSSSFLQSCFIIIQCIPMFTLAPIMVIWFGWSFTAIVIPTALMIFFPLTLNIYQGLRSTPQELLDFFKSNQATNWQVFIKLRLPWATKHIFSGLRISAAIAGVGAIAGEWSGAQYGLGIMMLESRRYIDLEITFGALICLSLISTIFYSLIVFVERMIFVVQTKDMSKKVSSFFLFPMRRKNLVFPVLVAMLFLSGCHRVEKNSRRLLLDWLPNPNHIPLYVGIQKKFFQHENIILDIRKMHDNGGGIAYLTSNQADLLVNHMPGTLKAYSRGAKLKIIGVLIKESLSGFIYRSEPDIRKKEDLSGRVLGYCVGGPDTLILDILLKQNAIIPSDRKNVSVDLVSAMGTHSVDFIYGGFWNIEPAQLNSFGLETGYFPMDELGIPNYCEMIIVANDNTCESSPEFVEGFKRALQKSIDFCKKNPDEAFKIYSMYNPDHRDKTLAWEREAWRATYPKLANDQKINVDELADFCNWLYDNRIINSVLDVKILID